MLAGQPHDNVLFLCCRSHLGTSILSVCPIISGNLWITSVTRIVFFTAFFPLKVNILSLQNHYFLSIFQEPENSVNLLTGDFAIPEDFLKRFSRYNFDGFCLGVLFTNRAFEELVLGPVHFEFY